MSEPKDPKVSLRNPLNILAMALDRQADELKNEDWKAAKRASAAKLRELAAKEPPPTKPND